MRFRRDLLLLLLLALGANASLAATVFTGEPFPLTGTRYGVKTGFVPELVSNGRDVFLFWRTYTHLHYRRADWEDSTPSRAIEAMAHDSYSVAWTGSAFLLVIDRGTSTLAEADDVIMGQRIDANGEILGKPFLLAREARNPRLAFDGTTALLLFNQSGGIAALPLRPDGTPAIAAPKPTGLPGLVEGLASNGKSFAAVLSYPRALAMFDGGGNVIRFTALGGDRGAVGIAANRERYLIAEGLSTLQTRLVENDGSIGAPLEVEHLEVYAASLIWTGSRWAIAYNPVSDSSSFTIAQVDAKNEAVAERERHAGETPSVAAAGDRLIGAWRNRSQTIALAEMPLNQTGGRGASSSATTQGVIATASAAHGTLVVWWEGDAVHAGVRMADGRWREQVIWPTRAPAAAATDGQTFAVVISEYVGNSDYRPVLLRLDAEGRAVGEPERLASPAYTTWNVVWTGRDYAVLSNRAVVQTAVDAAGGAAFSPPSPLLAGEACALAGNGDGFLAVWLIGGNFGSPSWPPTGVAGIRLGPDFKPLDMTPTIFAGGSGGSGPPYIIGCDVAWDGKQYVVAWTGSQGLAAAHVPAGGGPPVVRLQDKDFLFAPKLTRTADGVAVQRWLQRSPPETALFRLTFLSRDGTVTGEMTFDGPDDELFHESPLLAVASLPTGDTAIVRTARQNDVPAEGSFRLAMNIVRSVPLPEHPRAPRVTAVQRGTIVGIEWDPPPQRVDGYRVEYRVDDQPWVEIESVLSSDQRSVSLPEPSPGRTTAFRVRAWNEAGLGEYSPPVVPQQAPRRRSAR